VLDALTTKLSVEHSGHSIHQVSVFMEILLLLDKVEFEAISGVLVFKYFTSPYILHQLFQHTSLILHFNAGTVHNYRIF